MREFQAIAKANGGKGNPHQADQAPQYKNHEQEDVGQIQSFENGSQYTPRHQMRIRVSLVQENKVI